MALKQREHMVQAYFRRTADGFEPLEIARSDWSWEQLHGVAVSGLLACGAEDALRELGREELVPSRFHVDLFRPTGAGLITMHTAVVRSSARLALIDVRLEQAGTPTARASALFLQPSENPDGEIWSPSDRGQPPPLDVAPPATDPRPPYLGSDQPWSTRFGDHQNAGRHQIWNTAVPVLLDEPVSTFQAVASIADTTNMVTNWGSGGISYINTDLSLTLTRRPDGVEIGLRTIDHVQYDGIVTATAEVFDRLGPLGTASITGLANARRTLDFSELERASADTVVAEHTASPTGQG